MKRKQKGEREEKRVREKSITVFWIIGILFVLIRDAVSEDIIKVDGSSTVYPITEAVADEYQKKTGKKVVVGISGTGGGFKKFCRGETDISNASRPIREPEDKTCKENGINYIELPVSYDALAVVVNKRNNWIDCIKVEELRRIWEPGAQGKVMTWSDVNPKWPKKPIKLFGPGVDSGTFDYFTEAIVGKEKASRGDYQASEDDNVLVQGISGELYSLGYFGLAYYIENKDKIKALKIDNGSGCIEPTEENVYKGVYQPLSRPLFIYVSLKSYEKVSDFVEFYLKNAKKLVKEVGYVPLPDKVYELALERWRRKITGSIFGAKGSQVGVKIEELMKLEEKK